MKQEQQAHRDRGHAQVVCQRGLRRQPPVSGYGGQLGKTHPQPDRDHHFDERDRDEDLDEPGGGHGRCFVIPVR